MLIWSGDLKRILKGLDMDQALTSGMEFVQYRKMRDTLHCTLLGGKVFGIEAMHLEFMVQMHCILHAFCVDEEWNHMNGVMYLTSTR